MERVEERKRPAQDRDADLDPGAYIGRVPERASDRIPGGISRADERVAAHSSRPGPSRSPVPAHGHREGPKVTDDNVREAGQDR